MGIYQGSNKISGAGAIYANNPVGAIIQYLGSKLPNGYLRCDGSEVPRLSYPELFDVIGISYGTPSNEAFFKLPTLETSSGGGYFLVKAKNFNVEGAETVVVDDSLYVKKTDVEDTLSETSTNPVQNKVVNSLKSTYQYYEGSITPDYSAEKEIFTMPLEQNGKYIIFAQARASIDDESNIMNISLTYNNSNPFVCCNSLFVRGTMSNGGGLFVANYYETKNEDGAAASLMTYGYVNKSYTITAKCYVIKIS